MRFSMLLLTFSALWAQDPIESRDTLNRGVQAFQTAHYAEAIQFFQKAVDLDPSNEIPRLYLATAYMQQYMVTSPRLTTRWPHAPRKGFCKY